MDIETAPIPASKHPKRTAEYNRRGKLKYLYNLTVAEYEELAKDGRRVCGTKESLTIDHDHKCCPLVRNEHGSRRRTCGKCIRGVLCTNHNLAEGHLHGDPLEAVQMLRFLLEFSSEDDRQLVKLQLVELLGELSHDVRE